MFGESKVATDFSGFAMTSWPPFAVNTGTGSVSRRFESFLRMIVPTIWWLLVSKIFRSAGMEHKLAVPTEETEFAFKLVS